VIVHAAPWVVSIVAPPLADGAVAVDDNGRVHAVGPLVALAALGDVVWHEGVLMPGVINAHLHLELSHLRVSGGEGLVPWIRGLLAERAGQASAAMQARSVAGAAARQMACIL
jgi:cytosine/adenosine deaminase-related metal-dependent hydrolase